MGATQLAVIPEPLKGRLREYVTVGLPELLTSPSFSHGLLHANRPEDVKAGLGRGHKNARNLWVPMNLLDIFLTLLQHQRGGGGFGGGVSGGVTEGSTGASEEGYDLRREGINQGTDAAAPGSVAATTAGGGARRRQRGMAANRARETGRGMAANRAQETGRGGQLRYLVHEQQLRRHLRQARDVAGRLRRLGVLLNSHIPDGDLAAAAAAVAVQANDGEGGGGRRQLGWRGVGS